MRLAAPVTRATWGRDLVNTAKIDVVDDHVEGDEARKNTNGQHVKRSRSILFLSD
jgi:hypothetical protein